MTTTEKQCRLAVLTARVDQMLANCERGEQALIEIQTEHLYDGDDFLAWCDRQWPKPKARDHLRRLLGVADVSCLIAFPAADDEDADEAIPQPSDKLKAELARLPEAHVRPTWVAVWKGAQASGLKITRALVRVAVNQTLRALAGAEPTPAEARAARSRLAARSAEEAARLTVMWGCKEVDKMARKFAVLPDDRRLEIGPHLAAIRVVLARP